MSEVRIKFPGWLSYSVFIYNKMNIVPILIRTDSQAISEAALEYSQNP